jgi:hypothetical protein
MKTRKQELESAFRIKRRILLEVLQLAKPALGGEKNQVEPFTYFWFDGEYVSAFNDVIGVKVAFATDFACGIKGEKLIGLLANLSSQTRDVYLFDGEDEEAGHMVLRAGGTRAVLPTLPIDGRLVDESLPKKASMFKATKEFMKALDLASLSVGNSRIAAPAQRGVTVIEDDGSLDLFSTDGKTISWMKFVSPEPLLADRDEKRVIIPKEFTEHFNRVMPAGCRLCLTNTTIYSEGMIDVVPEAMVIDEKEDLKPFGNKTKTKALIFSRLVSDDDAPPDFLNEVWQHMPAMKKAFAIPEQIDLAVARAAIMIPDEEPLSIEITENSNGARHLRLSSTNKLGKLTDPLKITNGDKHPLLSVNVDIDLIKRCLSSREKMAITDNVVVLKGPDKFHHFIATFPKETVEKRANRES